MNIDDGRAKPTSFRMFAENRVAVIVRLKYIRLDFEYAQQLLI